MGKFVDLTGQKFGKLLVEKRLENNQYKKAQFLCKCDCGNEIFAVGTLLKNGRIKSCGCLNRNDISGQRFGKLLVIKPTEHRTAKRICFLCRCDCGTEEVIVGKYLINGTVNSCKRCANLNIVYDLAGKQFGEWTVIDYAGNAKWNCVCSCGRKAVIQGRTLRNGTSTSCGKHKKPTNLIHGKSKTRLWVVWCGMKQRCYNPNSTHYKSYGARGIKICDEWLDFQNFHDWAYANGYDENAPKGKCTIDRIDNNKGYSPDNCRWISIKEQANNKQQSVWVKINGETKTLMEWCKVYNIKYHTVVGRIDNGWTAQRAITTPILTKKQGTV